MLFAVTGGGGYTGYHIGWKLSEGGHDVLLLDIKPPDPVWEETAPQVLYDALPSGKYRTIYYQFFFFYLLPCLNRFLGEAQRQTWKGKVGISE